MKTIVHLMTGALAIAAFTSCTPSTPASRIANNHAKFAGLPQKQQQLVEQGQIARGMSPDAVLLAWGSPESRTDGSDGGVPTMHWGYAGLKPVYTTGFYGGYNWGGWGGYRGYGRRSYPYLGIAPQVSFVPEERASVYFRNYKVQSWQRKR